MKRLPSGHQRPQRSLLESTFRVSLVLKGLDGVLELVGGVLLLMMAPGQIGVIVRTLTQHELAEDPNDLIAGWLMHLAETMTVSVSLFGAFYLLLHGLVKIVLVWAVLKNKLWAYPWMIVFLLIFIVFQTYQLWGSFSWGLLLLTLFDLWITWLTWHEFRSHQSRNAKTPLS